ncbi:unnamed protein product [Ranitomeya imitator]|uniref:Uncharacterized protein n=1 Tax=Ranitomeya imitator TaxID=111125 RepID=A0ABN9LMI0_9NEOB|nr:unnamed protein product [Ranitomeya imitator]
MIPTSVSLSCTPSVSVIILYPECQCHYPVPQVSVSLSCTPSVSVIILYPECQCHYPVPPVSVSLSCTPSVSVIILYPQCQCHYPVPPVSVSLSCTPSCQCHYPVPPVSVSLSCTPSVSVIILYPECQCHYPVPPVSASLSCTPSVSVIILYPECQCHYPVPPVSVSLSCSPSVSVIILYPEFYLSFMDLSFVSFQVVEWTPMIVGILGASLRKIRPDQTTFPHHQSHLPSSVLWDQVQQNCMKKFKDHRTQGQGPTQKFPHHQSLLPSVLWDHVQQNCMKKLKVHRTRGLRSRGVGEPIVVESVSWKLRSRRFGLPTPQFWQGFGVGAHFGGVGVGVMEIEESEVWLTDSTALNATTTNIRQ